MPRRELILPGGKTIPPSVKFQENMVFYAPLNKGDLTDWISGETGATSQDASVVWDDNVGMYLLSFNSTLLGHDCTALRFTSPQLQANLSGIESRCTVFMILKEVSVVGGYRSCRYFSCDTMKDVWERSPRSNICIDPRWMGQSAIDFNLKTIALVVENGRQRCYVNGHYVTDDQWADSLATPVSLGICDKNGHQTDTSSSYNVSQCSLYVKDVRVYNRTLSASEIAEL